MEFNPDNFQFILDSFVFNMNAGTLCIDDVEYEEVSCPEMYTLARAYAREHHNEKG